MASKLQSDNCCTSTNASQPYVSAQLVRIARTRGASRPLPSIEHNGQQYIVAEHGVEFEIRVEVVDPKADQAYQFTADIDGQWVGYNTVVEPEPIGLPECDTIIEGWLYSTGDERMHYRAFRMGHFAPSADAAVVEHPDEITAGQIVIYCDEVVATNGVNEETPSTESVEVADIAQKLSDGKKWFLQPGMKAEAGGVREAVGDWLPTEYDTVSSLPSLTIKYDTAQNLKLRGILDPSNPQHAAILRTSTAKQQKRTKKKKMQSSSMPYGVKRERDQQQEPEPQDGCNDSNDKDKRLVVPASADAQVVDLSNEDQPGPLKVNGRALKTDELAVCDLCDSDDDDDDGGVNDRDGKCLGNWTINKKPAISLC